MWRRFALVALLVGVPFGGLIALAYQDDTVTGVAVGAACGVGAGCAVAAYVMWSDRRWERWAASVAAELEPEGIVHRSDAALGGAVLTLSVLKMFAYSTLRGDRGGHLVLTKKRLVFVPRKHRIYTKRVDIPIDEIASFRPAGDVVTKIAVVTTAKQIVQLTVRNRMEWLAKLRDAKAA